MGQINIDISKKVFNEVYLSYLDNEDKYLVFYGGGSSGKSHFIAQRYIYKILKNERMNLLVVRATGDTNRTSTFALFKQIISDWNLKDYFKIRESDMNIKCKLNNNEIIFKGLDNAEKIKSTTFESGELTDIWVEEATECEESDINQLIVRLRGGKTKKQIVLSFNPININHWIKDRFVDNKHATVVHTTYKDNKFLSKEDRQSLESFKDIDEYYYQVYCLGQWGVLGKTIFDSNKIQNRIRTLRKPIKIGYFEYDYDGLEISNIKWVNDKKNGYIKIYAEGNKPGLTKYVIGGDTAGDGSDYFTGQVIDAKTGVQVAVLRHQMDEDLYAKQMYCLGKYYNDALIGIEANFSTYPIKELERLGYENMYVREREDTFTGKKVKAYGFKTTSVTRPLILNQLVTLVREHVEIFNDKETLEEMLTFVRNEKGRPEAQQGAHDDLVMGIAIAHYVKNQVVFDNEPIITPYRSNFGFEETKDFDIGEQITII